MQPGTMAATELALIDTNSTGSYRVNFCILIVITPNAATAPDRGSQ